MTKTIELEGVSIKLTQKKVKHLRVTVYRPHGEVKVSAPLRMSYKKIHDFIQSKIEWIKQHQKDIQDKGRALLLQYLDQEIHYVWGKPYLLKLSEHNRKSIVEIQENHLHLKTRSMADYEKKQKAMDKFYSQQLQQIVPALIEKWEKIIGVEIANFSLQKMKTRWGVCKPREKHIKLNTELAKKPMACLEYVVVHEIVHLLEASHNHRFKALMDQFMPEWKLHRKELKY